MDIALVTSGGRGVTLHTGVSGRGVFIRQSGSPGRYGVITLLLEPAPSQHGCSLSWEVEEDKIPVIFLDAVIYAITGVLAEEAFDGDYLSGCRIRVVDGAYNHVDSNENSYRMASALAMREALSAAGLYPFGACGTSPLTYDSRN